MKTLKYFGIIFLLISLHLNAQEYNCITASVQQASAQSRGRWLPSEGNLNVLIVFAEFPDDNYDVSNVRWVKGNAPQNMSGWIDQTWSATPTQGSLTHYFNEMSGNKLHFTGKVVHVVAPHTRDWYLTNYVVGQRRGNIQKEIIQQLDATWDFAEFDNWDWVADYTYNNVPDTYVDMIIFVWRNIAADRSDPNDLTNLGFYSNYGDLGSVGDINVDNNQRIVATSFGGENSIPYGSGVTVRNYLTEDPFRNVVHEFSHYLLGDNSMHNGFGFWGMLSAWGIRSYVANSFERYRLGWVADSISYTVNNTTQTLTGKTLSDFVTGRNSYRLVINSSSQEYFYIENHQKTSYWENNAPYWGTLPGNVESGVYVIRKVGTPSKFAPPVNWIQLIPADGRYDWQVNQSVTNPWGSGQLPVFKQLVPNKDNGYSDDQYIPFNYGGLASPQPIHFTEQFGSPVQDIRFLGDGKDAFRMDFNQVFSPWSNPNNQRAASQITAFGFEITNLSNGVYTLDMFVNTSVNASPSKPQNPHVSSNPGNGYMRVSWDANSEPDLVSYEVSRKVQEWGGYWEVVANTTSTFFVDTDYYYTDPIGDFHCTYRVRAKDSQNKYSVYSNETSGRAEYAHKRGAGKTTTVNYVTEVLQNYPNPFNPTTKLSYTISEASFITLKVFDVLGREIALLVNEVKPAGKFEVEFDASKLPSGIYFYNLTTGSKSITKKMMLVR